MKDQDLGKDVDTVVDCVEGVFEFAEEDGVAAAEFAFDVWEDLLQITHDWECVIHFKTRIHINTAVISVLNI